MSDNRVIVSLEIENARCGITGKYIGQINARYKGHPKWETQKVRGNSRAELISNMLDDGKELVAQILLIHEGQDRPFKRVEKTTTEGRFVARDNIEEGDDVYLVEPERPEAEKSPGQLVYELVQHNQLIDDSIMWNEINDKGYWDQKAMKLKRKMDER